MPRLNPFKGIECATRTQIKYWYEMYVRTGAAHQSGTKNPLATFCHDCTPEYMNDMASKGKCLLVKNAVMYGRQSS